MKMGHKLEAPAEIKSGKAKSEIYYPSLYLDAKESGAVPESCCEPGAKFKAEVVFQVRQVSMNANGDGKKTRVDLDVLEISPEMEDEDEDTTETLGYDRKSDPNYKRQNKRGKVRAAKGEDLED